LIAYPDQFGGPDDPPLAALRRVVCDELAPEINGVHTLPLHPSSSDGGFAVMDYGAVDPAYGDWADVEALAGDVRWMADAVINHVSAQGDWFRRYLAGDPTRDGFFREVSAGADLSTVTRPRALPLTTTFERVDGTEVDIWTTFGPDQVDLDYRNPDVLVAVVDAVLEFVSRGADAIRLDAVAYVGKQEGTTSIHLPETHRIVRLLRACVDAVEPGVVLVTETNVPHRENISYLGADGVREAQAVYQFSLPPLVLHALVSGDTEPLRSWAAAAEPAGRGRTMCTFLACHDGVGLRPAEGLLDDAAVGRLAEVCTQAGGVVNRYRAADGTERPYELAATWFAMCHVGYDEAVARQRHLAAHAVMLAVQGLPLLYVHSLFGSVNDEATYASTGHGRDLNRARFGGAEPWRTAAAVWEPMREMIGWRRRNPAFHPEADQQVLSTPAGVFAVQRTAASGQRAVVAVNLSSAHRVVTVPAAGEWRRTADGVPTEGDVSLTPWQVLWLEATIVD